MRHKGLDTHIRAAAYIVKPLRQEYTDDYSEDRARDRHADGAVAFVAAQPGAPQRIDLAERLAAGTVTVVNREATKAKDRSDGIHISEREGNGLLWMNGSDFAEGTIEVDIRGRDLLQRSFVGIAFHGKDDKNYEAVYLRPFNFRATDPDRHQHAVQYMASPDYDWPRLRKEFPEEFENPVDASIEPTGWVPLRVVVRGKTIEIYVGPAKTPTLAVRKLGQLDRGMVGLWVGNGSDGDLSPTPLAARWRSRSRPGWRAADPPGPHLRPASEEASPALRSVLDRHQDRPAPLPAYSDALTEAQDDEQDAEPDADRLVGRQEPYRNVAIPMMRSDKISIALRPILSP